MRALTILLVRTDSRRCCREPCSNIRGYLGNHFPRIAVHEVAHDVLPSQYLHDPDVILIRPIASSVECRTVASFRRHWAQASLIGVVCSDRHDHVRDRRFLSSVDDFLICPFREIDLVLRLHRAVTSGAAFQPTCESGRSLPVNSLIGDSHLFQQTVRKIPLLAQCDATVLILGETGTGKELFARSVHYHSHRRGKPFIPVNCGALPDHLFENEMFGHVKGAFTDARAEHKGLLAEAEGGTLFLDEVDALSLPAQTKLLRVLQDHEYRPLGSSKVLKADVRILAATNASLHRKVEEGRFREDLYYRLNVLSLSLPPLRDRVEDILVLARHFLARYNTQLGKDVFLGSQAIQKLLAYPWPGNVRELQAVLQRAVTWATSTRLDAGDLDLGPTSTSPTLTNSLRHAKSQAMAHFERAYLTSVLMAHKGNISRAARAAGKERRSFQRLIRKYGLDRTVFPTVHERPLVGRWPTGPYVPGTGSTFAGRRALNRVRAGTYWTVRSRSGRPAINRSPSR